MLTSDASGGNLTLGGTNGSFPPCPKYQFDDSPTRYYMMAVICPAVSILGLLGNTASIVVFSRRQRQQATANSQAVFFIALAAYDNGVLITAFAIYTVEMIYDANRLLDVYLVWLDYLPTLFFLSNMFQCGAIYITIVATCERWLSMSYKGVHQRMCSVRGATLFGIGIAAAAISFCMSRYWELTTVHIANCTGFAAWHIAQTEFAVSEPYQTLYGVYLQNAFLIFIPFICMLAFNTLISVNIKDEERRREANVTMLVVALTFLVCSLPGFLLTIMERMPISQRFLVANPSVYSRLRDVINMLTVVNSSVNFFIYLIFGGGFRRDFRSVVTGKDVLWERNVLLTANIPLLLCSGPAAQGSSVQNRQQGSSSNKHYQQRRGRMEKTHSSPLPSYQSTAQTRRAQYAMRSASSGANTIASITTNANNTRATTTNNGDTVLNASSYSDTEQLCPATPSKRRRSPPSGGKTLKKGTSFMGALQFHLYGHRVMTYDRVEITDEEKTDRRTEQTELLSS